MFQRWTTGERRYDAVAPAAAESSDDRTTTGPIHNANHNILLCAVAIDRTKVIIITQAVISMVYYDRDCNTGNHRRRGRNYSGYEQSPFPPPPQNRVCRKTRIWMQTAFFPERPETPWFPSTAFVSYVKGHSYICEQNFCFKFFELFWYDVEHFFMLWKHFSDWNDIPSQFFHSKTSTSASRC